LSFDNFGFLMKVLHVIPSLSPTQGGPSFALPLMERALAGSGVVITVVTTDDDGPGRHAPVPLAQPVKTDYSTRWYFPRQTGFYKVSLPLRRWLKINVRRFDLIHIHALFSYSSTVAARAARRQGIPYLIRPLGVLNRWGMENRRQFLKSLSFRFIEKPILRHAAAMHYTSLAEQREAEQAGATAPAAVIPLGIDTAEFQNLPGPERFLNQFPQARGKKLVLFLSRLDAKKGLDLLLPAFAEIKRRQPEAMLVLVGNGAEDFTRGLHALAARLGLTDDILWPGFLAGAEKLSALSAAAVFVLPSYSENFGIALVEALAAGLPCVTTTGVAVGAEIAAEAAGLVVPPEKPALAGALEQLLADEALRFRLGGNARRLAQDRFSLAVLGGALQGLYRELVLPAKPD
jgi:glycosyltransferase involved in cell wall biosynthesis